MGREKFISHQGGKKNYLVLIAALCCGAIGSYLWFNPQGRELAQESLETAQDYMYRWGWQPQPISPDNSESRVLALVLQTPEAREAALRDIAAGEYSLERHRARYLLASDLLQKYEGGQALVLLRDLEKDHPVLAPYILLKRGRAYQLTNEVEKAQATWLKIKETYPESAAAAQALYQLGNYETQYLEEMVQEYPQHPLTHQIVKESLETNPDQFELLLLLAKYDHNYPTNLIRDRLVTEYNHKLTDQDWQKIGAGYWQNREYRKAADAYRYAPSDPRSLYRTARGLHLNGNIESARHWYKRLITDFPDAQETALALEHLATLSGAKASLFYLDLLIRDFPEEAATALYRKAIVLDYLKSPESAAETRQLLLEKYPDAEATAEYRWSEAEAAAKKGNKQEAIAWIEPLLSNYSYSDIIPKAAFWAGKWSLDLGDTDNAEKYFHYVLSYHWQSYYAWRSAVFLGWDVGDFDSVRQLQPEVIEIKTRPLPPAGSETFQELFLLGEDGDAYNLFISEIGDRQDLTVTEQFTLGLLKVEAGEYRQAVNSIWNLKLREEPRERQQWRQLRENSVYWQTLFPFPYYDTILEWSQNRELNPLLVISLMRQESTFETDARSPVGATGLMQVMPSTAQWISEITDISGDYSLEDPEDNITLGTWYLLHTHQQYDDNSLFAIASYNAGPGNVNKWKKRYSLQDLDVFVENIPFPETEGYVKSVFGNYWNYIRIYNPQVAQLIAEHRGLLEYP